MSKKIDTRPFHLKQFSLFHHQSSMKVGTDSLLLGIWTNIEGANHILDIGTGCGILALLMASRSEASIDAVELDKASFGEAKQNFNNSPFHNRLTAFQTDFKHFVHEEQKKYDLIISNPPFFINDLRSTEEKRKIARHGDKLNFEELCAGVANLLNANGCFCLVLPYEESKFFVKIANEFNLQVNRQLLIFPKRGLQPNRVNLELSFTNNTEICSEKFVIREDNNQFSEQYIDFFKDYLIGLN